MTPLLHGPLAYKVGFRFSTQAIQLYDKKDSFSPTLSGGEMQKTTIARTLVHYPQLLTADEPTGNLDPKNSKDIAELFKTQ